jgi:hypothetical protein
MNALNRGLAILLGAVLLAGGAAAALAVSWPSWRAGIDGWLPQAMEQVSVLLGQPAEVAGVGILVALLGLALLLAELRPNRAESQLLLREDSAGEVTILVDSTRRLVNHVTERIANVKEVQSLVIPTAKGLRVRCRIAVDPAASVPELAREVQSRVGAALEHHLGRPVDEVSVVAQIMPLSAPRRRRVR